MRVGRFTVVRAIARTGRTTGHTEHDRRDDQADSAGDHEDDAHRRNPESVPFRGHRKVHNGTHREGDDADNHSLQTHFSYLHVIWPSPRPSASEHFFRDSSSTSTASSIVTSARRNLCSSVDVASAVLVPGIA